MQPTWPCCGPSFRCRFLPQQRPHSRLRPSPRPGPQSRFQFVSPRGAVGPSVAQPPLSSPSWDPALSDADLLPGARGPLPSPSLSSPLPPPPIDTRDRGPEASVGRGSSTGRRRVRVAEVAQEVQRMRQQMEEDEQVGAWMRALRGQSMRDAQWADEGVTMRLLDLGLDAGRVTTDEAGQGQASGDLPLVYDPDAIARYWGARPLAVAQRLVQLLTVSGSFLGSLLGDLALGRLPQTEVQRARELREIVTSLGPAYIKLGQALSIRPDVLSPAAMVELQQLCDKVPSFPTPQAMALIEQELGVPPKDVFQELSPLPIAAASLGQVYKGRLRRGGQAVAVKVQRPFVLETVTVDLFILRRLGVALRGLPQLAARLDVVGLVDEWAARFFEELDYANEAHNADLFAESMAVDLPQVVVPRTFPEYTSRRVLVTEWIEGEKLSQSGASDVGALVNVGVICYLKQLLDTGLFHADPHPGNLIRTPDGRLCVLDFGLMTRITEEQKYGMIEAISHLIHRDYPAIVHDFVLLGFIPEGVDLSPIMPVLARVFDQALEGGGAKGINFQELAADLAQITFQYPFRIPPYFALIIRAIGVLEGIALVGDPDFAIVDAAYPYIAKRLLTDPSPRLRAALRYTLYGRSGVLDADRVIDVMEAFETFTTNSQAGKGGEYLPSSSRNADGGGEASTKQSAPVARGANSPHATLSSEPAPFSIPFLLPGLLPLPLSFPFPLPLPLPAPAGSPFAALLPPPLLLDPSSSSYAAPHSLQTRAALAFLLSPEAAFFRGLLLDEVVKGIDALSRYQAASALHALLPLNAPLLFPLPFPLPLVPDGEAVLRRLVPRVTQEDEEVVENVRRVVQFLAGTKGMPSIPESSAFVSQQQWALMASEFTPLLPTLAAELGPDIAARLSSRLAARFLRENILGKE